MIYLALAVVLIIAILSYSYFPSQYIKWKTLRDRPPEGAEKDIYLTFDDGPSEYTPKVLQVLGENGVKAAFFIVSDYAEKMPQVVEQIRDEGHLICIHSKSHQSLLFRGRKKTKEDMETAIEVMNRMGLQEKYYRPPWGHLNLFVLWYVKKMNLKLVMWHVMPGDWKADITVKQLEENILRETGPGSIICLHDGRGSEGAPDKTIQALKTAIPRLQRKGYAFRRLDSRYERESFH